MAALPGGTFLQVSREKLVHLGTCIGKLTHSGKFRLTVGALDVLAQHAKYKVDVHVSFVQHIVNCCPSICGLLQTYWPDDEPLQFSLQTEMLNADW